MNICLFTPSFLPKIGGMEIVVDRLARLFTAAGHNVTVLAKAARRAPGPGTGRLAGAALPYPVVHYPRSRSQVWLLGSTKRALLAAHAEHRFHIIHVHQAYPTGHVATQLRRRLGVPVVITSHRGDVGLASRYRRRWITRRRMIAAIRAADAVTGVSDELKTIIDELAGDPRAPVDSLVIPNGVDLDAQPPSSPPPELIAINGKPYAMTLGRLHPYKGLDVLLSAVAILRGRGITPPHLVVAGEGEIRDALQRQTASMGLGDAVSFVGPAFGDAKNWLLANCAFFVQPSRHEGMPLTVLEAMAAGKAVIGSDLPGIRQLVTPGATGLLAPVESAEGLADAIARLAGNPAEAARLGAAARLAAAGYAWPAIADRYLQLFQSLIT